ncbi:hypothetical protein CC1G_14599 [Coprinopsis cinerea okayama7|uniref:Uncharacterized protein n=1 Tax=Coprinopsis cinerea (strain Okayama-7 / 130 / ATCC MYA-4618 / FGSC 9003) TaxID=240176 RepID=D6RMH3_COPC7|nr:hypothetical protein CC1G_14599 [Coprinopsis cinerea okayama7\|eukprot:XP_002911168.1 hypothetical protein CC1G_14599 [Coprinopsis cinerea okayama7\
MGDINHRRAEKSLPMAEYQRLIDSLTEDKERVKRLQQQAVEREETHRREIQEHRNRAKWLAVRNNELEKRLKHAMKVIVDLQEEKERTDPESSLDELDEEVYRSILTEAQKLVKMKAKNRAQSSTSSSARNSPAQTSDRTPRPSGTPRGAGPSRLACSQNPASILSPVNVSIPRETPLNSHLNPPASSQPKSEPDEFEEAFESHPWLPSSHAETQTERPPATYTPNQTIRSRYSFRKSIATSTSSAKSTIFWDCCPFNDVAEFFDWEMLKERLDLTEGKVESLRKMENPGLGLRVKIVTVKEAYRVAFIYRPVWYESRSAGLEGIYLVDWCLPREAKQTTSYLRKRGVREELSEQSPILHVVVYVHDDEERDATGWWYIGAMKWQEVHLEKAAEHLSERGNGSPSKDEIVSMFEQGTLAQISIKMVLPENRTEISRQFRLPVFGTPGGGRSSLSSA